MHGAPASKKILEYVIFPIETIKTQFGQGPDFTSKNWLSPLKKSNKSEKKSVFKKKTSTDRIHIKILTERGLDFIFEKW